MRLLVQVIVVSWEWGMLGVDEGVELVPFALVVLLEPVPGVVVRFEVV